MRVECRSQKVWQQPEQLGWGWGQVRAKGAGRARSGEGSGLAREKIQTLGNQGNVDERRSEESLRLRLVETS